MPLAAKIKLALKGTSLVLILVTLAVLAGCGRDQGVQATPGRGVYQTITPEDYKNMLDRGDDHILVDVRTEEEFSAGHIEGALNIPVETLTGVKPAALPDEDAVIVLYCRSGNRSETAANMLLELGYQNVYDLGGIIDWPYETVGGGETAETAAAGDGILGAFKTEDIDGNTVDESIFRDYKLTMVNIWATFCGPCIDEMPELGVLHRTYADKGVQVVGIVVDVTDSQGSPVPDMIDTAKEIIELTGAGYPHLLPSEDLNAAFLYRGTAVPTTIFVDETGSQVGEVYVGAMSGEEWAGIIDALLKEVG